MLKTLKRAWRSWVEGELPANMAPGVTATFKLTYGSVVVGDLVVRNGRWGFQYSEEFRHRPDLRPLVQFPDKHRTYDSPDLWPFFALRIPSINQPWIRAAVKREHIDSGDKVQMLRRFGRRTIANPYELVSS
jgi:HipA-like protein